MISTADLVDMLVRQNVSDKLTNCGVNLTVQVDTEVQRCDLSRILQEYQGDGLDLGTGRHIFEVNHRAALFRVYWYLCDHKMVFSMQIDLRQ